MAENGTGPSVKLHEASDLYDAGEYDESLRVCNELLNEEPDNGAALFQIGLLFLRAERWGLAYNVYRRFTEIMPEIAAGWTNLGRALQELHRGKEAEDCFLRCLDLEGERFPPLNNLLLCAINRNDYSEAIKWAERAKPLATGDSLKEWRHNVSLAYLATRRWKEGWECFEASLPSKWRKERNYAGEGRWDGTPNRAVVFHGEQGIGDELMFASILPEAIRDCSRSIIECDSRLEGLFRRTFPQATVYGTRFHKYTTWPPEHRIEARCAFGSLARFYRNRNEDFPRKPFLVADPDRRLQWRSLLDTLPGLKIGLAWTGGTRASRQRDRSLLPEQLKPLLDTGHTFVSLEYRNGPTPDGVKLWRHAVHTTDYDDTAALVAELDRVVSVTTAVALLAGALGTPCHVMVPEEPTWHWCPDGEMPWFDIKLYRRKGQSWTPVVQEIAGILSSLRGRRPDGRSTGPSLNGHSSNTGLNLSGLSSFVSQKMDAPCPPTT